ncbi:hypothetical protein ACFPVX_23380 [Cohnella faecalis]|uniref:Fimbrial assembly protein n=1 Tax=Cohnella faecalis TaxID=2315694 RepID=A0A398CKE3_9BACL|nr:hypothetical protein [Cohnella faecalis]RIE01348.1 hypothetical protein D3H35_23535 [Cohnella faecalis]
MKYLNLLPRRSLWQRYFVRLMVLIVTITIASVTILVYGFVSNRSEGNLLKQGIAELESQIQTLSSGPKEDPYVAAYSGLERSYNVIRSQWIDWISLTAIIRSPLPSEASIKTIQVEANHTVKVQYGFGNMDDVIPYMAEMKQAQIVNDVSLNSYSKGSGDLAYDVHMTIKFQ